MKDALAGVAVFVRVLETGSFTRAAIELGLTKSTVSDTVRRLENRLGVRLLHRTTRQIAPTEAGQALYARGRKAVEEAQVAFAEVRALQEEPGGRLRVASPEVFTRQHLAPILPAFLKACPGVQVEFLEGAAPVDLIEAGVDIAIRIASVLSDSLVVRRLGVSRVIVAASPAYLARRGTPADPRELGGHDIIGFTPLHWAREWPLVKGDEAVNVPVRPLVLTNTGETLRAAALAGLGLAAMPSWMIVGDLARGALVEVLADWRAPEAGIYAVYPSNQLMARKVRLFADLVARRVRELGLTAAR